MQSLTTKESKMYRPFSTLRYGLTMFIILFFILPKSFSFGIENEQETKKVAISSWIKLGPIRSYFPVFKNIKNIKGKEFNIRKILNDEQADVENWQPQEGGLVKWNHSNALKWSSLTADSNHIVFKPQFDEKEPEIIYLATYIDVARWIKAKLEVHSFHLLQVYLDGKVVTSKTSSEKTKSDTTKAEPGKIAHDLKLETGKHLLLIKTLRDPENNSNWDIKATLQIAAEIHKDDIKVGTDSKYRMDIKHLLDGPKVANASISPDGELAAITIRQTLPPSDKSETWLELRQTKDGTLVQTFRGGMKISNIQWAPTGQEFSYTSSTDGKNTLWIVDLEKGTTSQLLKDIEDFGSYSWAPQGKFIIYSITEKPEPDDSGVKRLETIPARWPWWYNRSFLYLVNVPEGTKRRLTSGKLSTQLSSISPDEKKLLFTRSIVDFSERPYSKTEFFTLHLETMELDTLWTSKWAGSAQWSPDGKKLLVTGGPSMFGKIGIQSADILTPNDYDTQAYLYDLKTRICEPITRDFNPTIGQAIWSKTDNSIYFNTVDKSFRHLYQYNVTRKTFKFIDTGVEVLNSIDIAQNRSVGVYIGSSATVPQKAFVIDLKKKKFRILANPSKDDFKNVEFGKVNRWTFNNKQGIEIEGRIYYPPGFDPDRKYPCIVYYYGGTFPTTRDFGGRYPKNLYTAQGYVVYVLQPSGAVGFGQEFSALHVNDWGTIVADEIITGTKEFLAAHPFVDKNRVGCIGASFGGFMTMLLQTRTDIFAAAISHAGISTISSYWGEGYWGFSYSAVATANSFPWNRKDIYIEQSPLFAADKINTPLLLLHGMSDTNVPPGESIQLYTALKLLGKDVEFVQVKGQNHLILNYNKRILWLKTILSWFDKWLKDQPQWWDDLHPAE